jgi:hypothetical protein
VDIFSDITVNNREKGWFWIGFRGLILADRSFILGGKDVSEVKRLNALEEENARLKKLLTYTDKRMDRSNNG